jgi:hypothetical protein
MYYSRGNQAVFEAKIHSFWKEEASGTKRDRPCWRWTDTTVFSESNVQAARMGAIELFADKAESDASNSIEYNMWHTFTRYCFLLFFL